MKNSARTNPNIKSYLQWLRRKLAAFLSPKMHKRAQSFNVTLSERLFFEQSGFREKIFITGDAQFPIIKIIGLPDELDAITDEAIDDAVTLIAENVGYEIAESET